MNTGKSRPAENDQKIMERQLKRLNDLQNNSTESLRNFCT